MVYKRGKELMELLMMLTSEGVVVPSAFHAVERLVVHFTDAYPGCSFPDEMALHDVPASDRKHAS